MLIRTRVHLCLPGYRGEQLLYVRARRAGCRSSAFDLADEAALELGEHAELLERR